MTTLTKEEARRRQGNPFEQPWQIAELNMTGCISATAPGWNGDGTSSITTYERSFEAVIDRLAPGCLCIDKKALADHPDAVRVVLAAPLPTLRAPRAFDPADVDPLLGSSLLMSGWGGMLAGALSGAINLDESGPDAYAEYWRSKGARIGHFDGTAIIWEETAS